MITLAQAEFLAPVVLGLIEVSLKAVDPSLEAKLESYLPTAEKIAGILVHPDPVVIQAELVSLQEDAIDKLTAATLATASK